MYVFLRNRAYAYTCVRVCMCVWVYVCIYAYICMCMYVCMHACVYVRGSIHVYVYVYVFVYMYMCIWVASISTGAYIHMVTCAEEKNTVHHEKPEWQLSVGWAF